MTTASTQWKALLGKEWRESRLIVVLASVAILLLAGWDLSSAGGDYLGRRGFHDVMQRGFLIVVVASGFVLGLVQILRDTRADAWGLCVHRAVPRATIFHAKVLLGGGTLVAAWTLLTAALAGWCIWPGIPFVPFLPEFLLLSLGVQAVGLTAYAAGVAMAAGNGRWWASRWFPLLPAGLLVMGVHATPLWLETLLSLGCAALLLLVGRAYWMAGPGACVRRGGWLTTGPTWCVAAVSLVLVLVLAEGIFSPSRDNGEGSWQVDTLGQPLFVYRQHAEDHVVDEHGETVSGKHAAPGTFVPDHDQGISPISIWQHAIIASYPAFIESGTQGYGQAKRVMTTLVTRNEVLLYDRLTRQRIPWQTPDGPMQVLPGVRAGDIVIGPTQVWILDEHEGSARVLFAATPGERILSASNRLWVSGLPSERTHNSEQLQLVVQTDHRMAVQGPGSSFLSLPRPEPETWGYLYVISDGGVATLRTRQLQPEPTNTLAIYDSAGKTLSERTLVRPPGLPPVPDSNRMTIATGLLPLPALLTVLAFAPDRAIHPIPWPPILLGLLLHALAVGIVIRWSRRHQAAAAATRRWALLAGIVGWPTLVVFFVHAELPRLTPCPSCGRKRSLTAEHCPACGAAWPTLPPLDEHGIAS